MGHESCPPSSSPKEGEAFEKTSRSKLTDAPLRGVWTPNAEAVAITRAMTRRVRVEFMVDELWLSAIR